MTSLGAFLFVAVAVLAIGVRASTYTMSTTLTGAFSTPIATTIELTKDADGSVTVHFLGSGGITDTLSAITVGDTLPAGYLPALGTYNTEYTWTAPVWVYGSQRICQGYIDGSGNISFWYDPYATQFQPYSYDNTYVMNHAIVFKASS